MARNALSTIFWGERKDAWGANPIWMLAGIRDGIANIERVSFTNDLVDPDIHMVLCVLEAATPDRGGQQQRFVNESVGRFLNFLFCRLGLLSGLFPRGRSPGF